MNHRRAGDWKEKLITIASQRRNQGKQKSSCCLSQTFLWTVCCKLQVTFNTKSNKRKERSQTTDGLNKEVLWKWLKAICISHLWEEFNRSLFGIFCLCLDDEAGTGFSETGLKFCLHNFLLLNVLPRNGRVIYYIVY